eukprot:312671-Chlamydomonas_euryale.AAC.4
MKRAQRCFSKNPVNKALPTRLVTGDDPTCDGRNCAVSELTMKPMLPVLPRSALRFSSARYAMPLATPRDSWKFFVWRQKEGWGGVRRGEFGR